MTYEILILRSLVESDLGLFAVHRPALRGRQRAININATVARRLLHPDLYQQGDTNLKCIFMTGGDEFQEIRRLTKPQKNWRLGGTKIDGPGFSQVDSKDFMLMRSVAGNDGSSPVTITFICRRIDPITHAGLAAIAERHLSASMAVFEQGTEDFNALARYCPNGLWRDTDVESDIRNDPDSGSRNSVRTIPLMPEDDPPEDLQKPKSIGEKIRSPHIMQHMLRVSSDLSAPAQFRFMETIELLASDLRMLLLETGGIVKVKKNHAAFWAKIANQRIGFVDGGLANLSMFGSVPIAARVGGYSVIPGHQGSDREEFTFLKHLIDELYTDDDGGVYNDSFPDSGALRDAARISIEAAGGVRMLSKYEDLQWLLLHGALVNPVSRYTDIMYNGRVRHRFPDFSDNALTDFLPAGEAGRTDRDRNFVSVHLRQLECLQESSAVVSGVIERESTTTSVCSAVLDSLDDDVIADLLPQPPREWKSWFRKAIDPSADVDFEGQRIGDALLFRCVLEPGELLKPVAIDRNDLRRAPEAWKNVIKKYPKPLVTYLQVTEWTSPIRIELFEKDRDRYRDIADLVMHCSLLLPQYAFPAGLDIVDKFARIPNWMSRPVNTRTAVRVMKAAMDQGDGKLFNSIRHMLCGTGREFFTRPDIFS